MKPRKNYRSRPKKVGAKKKQKVASQKRRLVTAGCVKEKLDKMNTVEIRELLKKTAKKKGVQPVKKTTGSTSKKKSKPKTK
ncbi:MAG: hypothetical protein ABIH85_06765 [Candidatus Omnitrophota bacterium]